VRFGFVQKTTVLSASRNFLLPLALPYSNGLRYSLYAIRRRPRAGVGSRHAQGGAYADIPLCRFIFYSAPLANYNITNLYNSRRGLSWRKGMLVWVQEMDVPLAGKFALLLLLTPPQLLNWGQGREKGSMTPRRDRPVGIRG